MKQCVGEPLAFLYKEEQWKSAITYFHCLVAFGRQVSPTNSSLLFIIFSLELLVQPVVISL